jgi:methionyl-tRNA formyltransferase
MGVKAMLEAADLVVAGKHKEVVQDESQATYEGWFRANESKVNFHNHVSRVHDTIRAADPAPGAWTTINGKKLQLFGSKKHMVRTFGDVKGKIGEITEIGEGGMRITCQGGQVEVAKVKAEDTKKISPSEWAKATGVGPGTILGN